MADVRAHLETLTLRGWMAAAAVVVGLHIGGIGLATMEWPEKISPTMRRAS